MRINPLVDRIDGGATRGSNLFHSFLEFNIGERRAAYFAADKNIENIFSRVTGSNPSRLYGKLGVLGDANLFFINPNGIIFGRNASLDIKGSFVATTASSIILGDAREFSAKNPGFSKLSVNVKPLIGLQFEGEEKGISNLSNLQVPNGRSLLLVGGDLAIDGGTLNASGGRVELAGVRVGTVGLNINGKNLRLDVPDGILRADVSLTNRARVDVTGGDGGWIAVNARNLELQTRSFLLAGITKDLGIPNTQAGDITLNAKDSIFISQSSGIRNRVNEKVKGNSGNINIITNSLYLTDEAELTTETEGEGNAGTITINANDTVSFARDSQVQSQVEKNAAGNAGNINITARSLYITDDSELETETESVGFAGNVTINATDKVFLDNSEIESNVEKGATQAKGGNIDIITSSLFLTNNAELDADTRGEGNAGNITIIATDRVLLNRDSEIESNVEKEATGKGGNINITTGSFDLSNNALVNASSSGEGDAGNITIAADTFNASTGGLLRTTSEGKFPAGNIILKVGESITLSGLKTGLFANTTLGSIGNGGSIIIDPQIITVRDGAAIAVNSNGSGIGGNIELTAGSLTLDRGTISAKTRINTGGNIKINIQDLLLLRNGSEISTTAGQEQFGGNGGNININIPDGFIVAFPNENSDITANAFKGNSGNIKITTFDIFGIEFRKRQTNYSDITATSTFGLNGNVNINTSGIDPNRGVVQLPEQAQEVKVAQGCQAVSQSEVAAFFYLGRGGLVPQPDEPLQTESIIAPWIPLINRGENNSVNQVSTVNQNGDKRYLSSNCLKDSTIKN